MIIKHFIIWIYLLSISVINAFDLNQIITNHKEKKRFSRSVSSSLESGCIPFYIRESCDNGPQTTFIKHDFPYVCSRSEQLSSFGSLTKVSRCLPIYVNPSTKETLIRTLSGIYIIPAMIKSNGIAVSIGELIQRGYATVSDSESAITSYFHIESFTQPESVNQSNILTYDSRLQRFSGGVQTVCQSKFEETCETNCQDKPNYHQLSCKPKCKTHFAGFSLDSFQSSASSITTGTGSTTRISNSITTCSETVYGICNTIADGNSIVATVKNIRCHYPDDQPPERALDCSVSSGNKYVNFGACTGATSSPECGLDSGFYFTNSRGASLLQQFRFCTADDSPERDPLTISIAGSNATGNALVYGSSWTSIYVGPSGLVNTTSRLTCGNTIAVNSTAYYSSYRVLITEKRNTSNSVQYSEVSFW